MVPSQVSLYMCVFNDAIVNISNQYSSIKLCYLNDNCNRESSGAVSKVVLVGRTQVWHMCCLFEPRTSSSALHCLSLRLYVYPTTYTGVVECCTKRDVGLNISYNTNTSAFRRRGSQVARATLSYDRLYRFSRIGLCNVRHPVLFSATRRSLFKSALVFRRPPICCRSVSSVLVRLVLGRPRCPWSASVSK